MQPLGAFLSPLFILGVKAALVLLTVGEVDLAAARLAVSQPAPHDFDELRASDDRPRDFSDEDDEVIEVAGGEVGNTCSSTAGQDAHQNFLRLQVFDQRVVLLPVKAKRWESPLRLLSKLKP
jgi:hypothetical protein